LFSSGRAPNRFLATFFIISTADEFDDTLGGSGHLGGCSDGDANRSPAELFVTLLGQHMLLVNKDVSNHLQEKWL
jgi:hypothetical protein